MESRHDLLTPSDPAFLFCSSHLNKYFFTTTCVVPAINSVQCNWNVVIFGIHGIALGKKKKLHIC